MALTAVHTTSLADQVFEQLAAEIVGGRYPEGATIPSERDLTTVFGVNRHVVREGLQRLEQVGLVRIAQGGSTRVLDFRRTAGLDLLAVVAEHEAAAKAVPGLLAAAMEMRAAIGEDVARLCAQRAEERVAVDLMETAGRLSLANQTQLAALDESFWQRALDGAGNLAYQLAFNSLLRASHALPDLSLPWLQRELERCNYRFPIAEAILARDGERAARAARDALAPPAEALAQLAPVAQRSQAGG